MFYFEVKNFFFVFLGIENENTKNIAITKLKQLGKLEEFMNNGYVLTVISRNPVRISEIRDAASAGNDIIMVIRLTSDIDASWRLKTVKSKFLDSIVEELNG